MDNILLATGAKGISASVGVPDNGFWSSSRGITGNTSKDKITPDLEFYAGSIGKIFTAVVIFDLIEEERLSLNDSVDKWFPEINWASHVTINHLLTHTQESQVLKKVAPAGSINNFAKRGEGLLCHNNLYLTAKIFPLLAMLPGLILNFSMALLMIFLVVVGLLMFRIFVIFPKVACVHCRAKNICPNAKSMGFSSR